MKKQNFVEGALILMIANLLVKILGAIFKIPLTNIIGVDAMAYFNTAYGFYVIFYMISTAGLPVAVSKMVSAAEAEENHRESEKIFKISYLIFFVFGAVGMLIMAVFAKKYAEYVNLDGLEFAIYTISPTLFFICLTSAYRGYFQGLKNMTPTATSQVIEAIGKLAVGLIVAFFAVKAGKQPHIVAAYALLGVTIGALFSTVILKVYKRINSVKPDKNPATVKSAKSLIKSLIIIAIPVTLSATIMSLTNTIDTTFMVKRLIDSGFLKDEARKIMGAYTSMSVPLFNLPPNLIYPFAISIIPALTSAFVSGQENITKKIMTSTFRISSIIAMPCALGLSVFARPIISLLYSKDEFIGFNSAGNEISSISVASPLLSVLAISIFFVAVISVTNSILQSYGFESKTIISTVLGIGTKLILTYVLIGNERISMFGAPISTLCCYIVIMCANLYFVVKYTGFVPSMRKIFIKPFFSSIVSVFLAATLYYFLRKIATAPSLIISVVLCALLYFLVLFAIKGVEKEDILLLPKGKAILSFLIKIKLLKS